MKIENLLFFNFVDWSLVDVWVQVVVPSIKAFTGERRWGYLPLTTLLASASANLELILQFVGNESPLFCTILFDQFDNRIIFL